MTSTPAGHHVGLLRAETQTATGSSSAKIRSCRCQRGSPQVVSVALSKPIRRDSPPVMSMVVRFIRYPPKDAGKQMKQKSKMVLEEAANKSEQMFGSVQNRA